MGPTSRRPLPVTVAGVAVLLLVLAGCGNGELNVPSFNVTTAGHERCQELLRALPTTVDGLGRRTTTGSTFAVAWGKDPAIILRCGVGTPAEFTKFSACQRADGVDWFVPDEIMQDQHADVVMTTVGRSPNVEVFVPAKYRPTLAPMVDLASALKAHTQTVKPCQ